MGLPRLRHASEHSFIQINFRNALGRGPGWLVMFSRNRDYVMKTDSAIARRKGVLSQTQGHTITPSRPPSLLLFSQPLLSKQQNEHSQTSEMRFQILTLASAAVLTAASPVAQVTADPVSALTSPQTSTRPATSSSESTQW
uniref:Uncharacterized protein n=1 Tax=Bionectria ochroleuca TaxID=29856 RepID=A0A8H7N8D8_BIOOC